jgi:cytochrome c peroxidase
MMGKKILLLLLTFSCLLLLLSFLNTEVEYNEENTFQEPLGLPPIEWPANNLYSKEKVELGKLLFFDKRLSSDMSVSCATCHSIPKAFSDQLRVSKGIHGRVGSRHAPSLVNCGFNHYLFWDGRAATLEEQAIGPIGNPVEMTLEQQKEEAYRDCENKVKAIAGYRHLFEKAFGNADCTIEQIGQAIATFERTIVSGNSPFDRYWAGDKTALTKEQVKGFELFKSVGCMRCHRGSNFTDEGFDNIGIGMNRQDPDLGRYEVTHQEKDWGAFKVPTLREVSRTFPYMHDGSLKTLEEVVEHYNKGGIPNPNLSPLMQPLHLSEQDKKNLVLFLKSLNGEGWHHIQAPDTFPD